MSWYEDYKGKGFSLGGTHFVVDISYSQPTSGLILTNVDPRRQYRKPDAYAGKVLEVSSECRSVRIGDNIIFERWDWNQFNINEKLIVAREKELIIINEEPVSGYIIFKLEQEKETSKIFIPHTYKKERPKFLNGEVLASGVKDINVGEGYFFEAMDSYQYHYGDGRMAFRVNRGAALLIKYDPRVEKFEKMGNTLPDVVVATK